MTRMTQPPSDWNWPGLTPEAEAEDRRAQTIVYLLAAGCLVCAIVLAGMIALALLLGFLSPF
jgi:hypothetical protein